MKEVKISVLSLSLLIAGTMCFSSCKKDGGNQPKNSLEGTAWIFENYQYIDTYYFTSDSEGTYNQYQKGISAFDVPFSYVYNPPKITITMHYPSSDVDIEGTIDGDTMNLGIYGSYTKRDDSNY